MKQISSSLTSVLKKDSVVERDYIIFSGETTKHYIWFNIYDDCYNNGNFIGTFVMKRIEITYSDSDLEFKNKEFNAYKEYKLDDGTWESINYGTFVVQSIEESDTKEEIKVTAYDYALKFANQYKTDLDYASGNITLFQVLQEICDKVGVELENTSIDNGSFIVDSNQFTETSKYGNVVAEIARISCNFAKITPENKLKLLFKTETNIIIETKDYEEFEDKRDTLPYNAVSLGITDVDGENVSLIAPGVEPDDAKYLTINDNPFAYTQDKRTQLIQAIFDKINGFGYSSFVLNNCLYPQLECGDLIQIRSKEGQLVDSIVLRPTFEDVVINFEAPSTITSSVKYVQPLSAIETARNAERKIDKANLIISDVVKEVKDNTTKITSVEQSVDKINQTVSQITIPLNNVIGNDIITLENTSNTDIYKMSIKGDISLLYGNNGNAYGDDVPYSQILYPSSNLFGKNNYLVIKYSDEDIQKIVLPFTYLNYINNEVCDEFKIDDGKAYIIRRVGVNSSMQKYQLEEEIIEEIPDFKIQLKEGNPTIYLESFDTVMFDVTYMVKNEYTDTFATKIELNSSITQTKDEINIEVSKKVGKDEVVNTINVSTEEILIKGNRLAVEADNFKLDKDGTMETNNGTFENVTINGGKLNLSNGAEVVGDNGLITNLYFTSAGNMGSYQNLGFGQYYDQSNIVVYKSNTYLDIFIPENFVIKSAYLTIQHTPAKWISSNSQEVTGYARNVKIYKILDGYSYEVDNVHSVIKINEAYLSEIPNALGVNSYTPDKITAGQVSNLTSVVNIRDYINGSGLTTLVAQTSDNLPQANSDIISTSTGKAKLSVNIIGYMTFNN